MDSLSGVSSCECFIAPGNVPNNGDLLESRVFSVHKIWYVVFVWTGADPCVRFHHGAQNSVHLKFCGVFCNCLFSGAFVN